MRDYSDIITDPEICKNCPRFYMSQSIDDYYCFSCKQYGPLFSFEKGKIGNLWNIPKNCNFYLEYVLNQKVNDFSKNRIGYISRINNNLNTNEFVRDFL